jgi:hypothetical protein
MEDLVYEGFESIDAARRLLTLIESGGRQGTDTHASILCEFGERFMSETQGTDTVIHRNHEISILQ